jgi:hypothetical protein
MKSFKEFIKKDKKKKVVSKKKLPSNPIVDNPKMFFPGYDTQI